MDSGLLCGFRNENFKASQLAYNYQEDENTFFEVTFHESRIYPNTEIAYLSWIQGHGSGVRLLGYILEKLLNRSARKNKKINLFIEPTTYAGFKFIDKLTSLGIKLIRDDSEVNSGCRGYTLPVTAEVLKILAGEA